MSRGRQIIRQWKILRALEASRLGLTAVQLREVAEDGCALRTIYRDMEQIEASGFPILSDEGRWRLLEQGEGAWSIPLTPTELLALAMTEDLLAPVEGTVLAEPLRELASKLQAMLTPRGRDYVAELSSAAIATLFAPGDYTGKGAELGAIAEAIRKEHRLKIRYATPHKAPSDRIVEPYSTWYAGGRVYLIAFCTKAGEIRIFAVQRIENAKVLDEPFDPDPTFDPATFSRLGFGVFHGDTYQFVIELEAEVAHLIRERRYHHTQRVIDLNHGRVRLEMEAAGLPEVAAWVAGFGGNARPLEPKKLVDAVRKLHENGLRRVGD